MQQRLKEAGRFIWKNADGCLVVAVAFGVVILEVLGSPSPELLDSAILGLLGVTAIVLLRDRVGRDDLAAIRQLAGDAISDRPYEVVSQRNEWDLTDRDHSVIRRTEQIRFTRNDVSTMAHWSAGPGTIERYDAKWRRPDGDRWIPAHKIHEFAVRTGQKVIYSFDEEHCRGDMIDWCIERDAVGRFPDPHESVTLEAHTKSDHPRVMRVTWPSGVDPTNVELRYEGHPATQLGVKRKGGRAFVEEKVTNLNVGQKVEISWTW